MLHLKSDDRLLSKLDHLQNFNNIKNGNLKNFNSFHLKISTFFKFLKYSKGLLQ